MSKYDELVKPNLKDITSWYRKGATDKIVAEMLGIGYSTYKKYKTEHEELEEAGKSGKEWADVHVVSELYKNATGYHYQEQVAFKCKDTHYDNNGKRVEKERIEVVDINKWHAGETVAQIFWLKNRVPTLWKDRVVTNTNEDTLKKVTQILETVKENATKR